MKNNNHANFQAKKHSHKAQQRAFKYFLSRALRPVVLSQHTVLGFLQNFGGLLEAES